MRTIKVQHPVKIEIKNHLTKKSYFIKDLADDNQYQELIPKIVKVCNEPKIFKRLFARKFTEGDKYTPINALKFLVYGYDGWKDDARFLFGIFSEDGEMVGALELRSNKPEACEIGYWASENHRGFMSNALIAISKFAKEQGYQKLFLLVAPDNIASQKVAKNAGYLLVNPHFENPKGVYYLYEKELI